MINDVGLGYCAECKEWLELPSFHPKDKKLPRPLRRRLCAKCARTIKKQLEPFTKVKLAIANHKVRCGEGDYTLLDLMRLYNKQGCKCAYCNTHIKADFTIEHIIPIKFGGRNLKTNILLICDTCNSSKQHFELVYWLQKQQYRLRELIFRQVKGAYDYHEYEFSGTCEDCVGQTRNTKTFCTSCTSCIS